MSVRVASGYQGLCELDEQAEDESCEQYVECRFEHGSLGRLARTSKHTCHCEAKRCKACKVDDDITQVLIKKLIKFHRA